MIPRLSHAELGRLYAAMKSGVPVAPAKKSRKPKLPGVRESVVVRDVLAYLKDAGLTVWRNNSGSFTNARGRQFRMAPAGSSDVLGCLPACGCIPGGRMLAIELKRPKGGTLSDAQRKWQGDLAALGALCFVARGTREVCEALRAAGYRVPEPKGWYV